MKTTLLLIAILLIGNAYSQIVNIPDANLKAALVNHINPVIDTNGDGEIQTTEALAVTTSAIRADNKGIVDPTGIEAFTNAEILFINNNSIAALDVTSLTSLKQLYCGANLFATLDVSQNTALIILSAGNPNISFIDVSNNPNLAQFKVENTPLDSVNFSNNPLLTHVWVRFDALSTIDLSNNPNIYDLRCGYNTISSLDVTTINNLTNLQCEQNNLTSIDVTNAPNLTTLVCGNNTLTSLDISQNTALVYLTCNNISVNSFDLSNHTLLTKLNVADNAINTLDLTNNSLISELHCEHNNLDSLDVSNLTNLIRIFCGYNSITALDLSSNTQLEYIYCYDNTLDSLNLAVNTSLKGFFGQRNNLTYLNLKNGNNTIMSSISAGYNPNLYCITVDDSLYSETTWRTTNPNSVDPQTVFNGDCVGSCFIPVHSSIVQTACFEYDFNGQILAQTGYYYDTLSSVSSCKDSIIKLSLTINSVNIGTVQIGNSISAGPNATYQWLDCDNGYAPLVGDTNQIFDATSIGNYAVAVTQNGCTDTSACTSIIGANIEDNSFANEIRVFPNPTKRNLTIDLGASFSQIQIEIMDVSGRIVYAKTISDKQLTTLNFDAPKGIYTLVLKAAKQQKTIKIIKL